MATRVCQPVPSDRWMDKTTGIDIDEAGNEDKFAVPVENEAFRRWRPSYHLIAPWGWMNDPCAPGFDPKTGFYHLAFQWNPKGNDWGDISWGRATSRDLVSWKVSSSPVLVPVAPYDCEGVFTGCSRPTDLAGQSNEVISYFYTSVNHLPIHYTREYHRGSETLSAATSNDGGKSWKRYANNPILPGPPEGIVVTGWRDPFINSWPSLTHHLGKDGSDALYGCISGGVYSQFPTSFLYSINPKNLTKWTYMGPLMSEPMNRKLSRWSGDLGKNWEVTNMLSLRDAAGASHEFLIVGSEGCVPQKCVSKTPPSTSRTARSQIWVAGSFSDNAVETGATPKVVHRELQIFDVVA